MQFIKAHWIALLSGLVVVGSAATAMVAMQSDTVVQAMKKEQSTIGAGSIASLRGDPKNEEIIAAAEARSKQFATEFEDTLAAANEINRREPLMAGVFPEAERSSTPLMFIDAYKKQVEALPRRLSAGTLPTEQEYADEAQNVQDLLALEEEQQREEDLAGDGRQPAVAVAPRSDGMGMRGRPGAMQSPGVRGGGGMGMRGDSRDSRMGMSPRDSMMAAGPRDMTGMGPRGGMGAPATNRPTSGEPKYDPTYRARVNKALDIRCYVESFIPGTRMSPTFDISPIVNDVSAPTPDAMWYAQVSLWIQQDVADAIGAMNKAAAAKVTDGDAHVQHMPVKRLKIIRVEGYELASEPIMFPSIMSSASSKTGERPASLTARTGNELYDVVRFQVVAVVHEGSIFELVDAISTTNYYVNTALSYVAVDRAVDQDTLGYFYGTDAVVEVVLNFEGYLLREAYTAMMPKLVREALGIKNDG